MLHVFPVESGVPLPPPASCPPATVVTQKPQQIRFQDDRKSFTRLAVAEYRKSKQGLVPINKSPTLEPRGRGCSRCGYVNPNQGKPTSDSSIGIDMDGPRDRPLVVEAQIAKSINDHSNQHWRWSYRKFEEEQRGQEFRSREEGSFSSGAYPLPTAEEEDENPPAEHSSDEIVAELSPIEKVEDDKLEEEENKFLNIPKKTEGASSSSAETLTGEEETLRLPTSPSHYSNSTVRSGADSKTGDDQLPPLESESKATAYLEKNNLNESGAIVTEANIAKIVECLSLIKEEKEMSAVESSDGNAIQEFPEDTTDDTKMSVIRESKFEGSKGVTEEAGVEVSEERRSRSRRPSRQHTSDPISPPPRTYASGQRRSIPRRMSSLDERSQTWHKGDSSGSDDEQEPQRTNASARRRSSGRSQGTGAGGHGSHLFVGARGRNKRMSTESEFAYAALGGLSSPRSSVHTATPRSSFQVPDSPQHSSRVGVVITSSRQSQRRSSSASAAAAFAVATAGSSNPRDLPKTPPLGRFSIVNDGRRPSFKDRPCRQESIISTAATMRVLNVLRHWVSKHWQDFESDGNLCQQTIEFLEDLVCCATLLPAEHKAASQLLRLITNEEPSTTKVDVDALLAPPTTPSKENIETLSAMDIAEQMTYIDHQIFVSIRSEELLKTAWTKDDKQLKAPHIILITKRFNEMSRLVASEVLRRATLATRISVIEKWVAVADICRVLHNFNGVLQVCAAFQNSSVFRLKKTWEKVNKTTRQTLEKLQTLVSADGRFRSFRDALHRCDPPCIPYLGMYLTDLSFIEEGTPNFTEDGLLNFSKMRMIAHVIREIRHFQQTPYKIEHIPRVCSYLLDLSLLLNDDELYRKSLDIEPRRMTLAQTAAPSTTGSSTPTSTSSS